MEFVGPIRMSECIWGQGVGISRLPLGALSPCTFLVSLPAWYMIRDVPKPVEAVLSVSAEAKWVVLGCVLEET